MDLITVILATCAVSGLYMAWNIGANVVPNLMGMSIGSSALSLRGAMLFAATMELAGAMLLGEPTITTIGRDIVSGVGRGGLPLALGMTCCLISASLWLVAATWLDWPVSTTHSIVGSVLGLGFWLSGGRAIDWPLTMGILVSWVVSPVIAGVAAYYVFTAIRRRVLAVRSPDGYLAWWSPMVLFALTAAISGSMLTSNEPLTELGTPARVAVVLACGAAAAMAGVVQARRAPPIGSRSERIERRFVVLQIASVGLLAFAHGGNDVANAVGPMAAVFAAVRESVQGVSVVPLNVLVIGAFGIVLGFATHGSNVMAMLGQRITELTPSRGFAAEVAAGGTVLCASHVGLPISTTHTLLGAVIGVGVARAIGALDLRVLRGVVASLVLTVPITSGLTALLMTVATALLPSL